MSDIPASSSKSLKPRVFLVNHSTGGGMEFIPPEEYTSYVNQFQGKQGVIDVVDETSCPYVKLHRFVKDYAAVWSTVPALPVSEGAVVAPAQHCQAMASLKMPCKAHVSPTAGLVLPRLAAASDPQASAQPPESVLLVKEFMVHDAPKEEDIQRWQELHTQCKQRLTQFKDQSADPATHPKVLRCLSTNDLLKRLEYHQTLHLKPGASSSHLHQKIEHLSLLGRTRMLHPVTSLPMMANKGHV